MAKQPETITFVPVIISCLNVISKDNTDLSLSFLGRSVTRSCALALLNLLTIQLENDLFPAILESWKNDAEDFLWLLPLWAHRDPIVRSAGLNIAAGLSRTKKGRIAIIKCFKFVPGGVWNAALSFLFSDDEPDMVKFSAVKLITTLLHADLKRTDLTLKSEVRASVELHI